MVVARAGVDDDARQQHRSKGAQVSLGDHIGVGEGRGAELVSAVAKHHVHVIVHHLMGG